MSRKSDHLTLADEALAVERYKPQSEVVKIAATMPPQLRAEFADALANPNIGAKRLAEVLTGRGYEIGYSSITNFRSSGKKL